MQSNTLKTASHQQFHFASYLNEHINPLSEDGKPANLKPSVQNPEMMRTWLEILSQEIFKIIDEFNSTSEFSSAQNLVKESKPEEALNKCAMYFVHKTDNLAKEILLHGASSDANNYFLSFLGGLQNALQLHFALVKLAIQKSNLKDLLLNLKHLTKELSQVHALTLKLIYNLNGFNANQNAPYQFDTDNFELANFNSSGPYLLPRQEFLDQVIKKANDSGTKVITSSSMDSQIFNDLFSKNYTQVEGCPIHGARVSSQSTPNSNPAKTGFFAEYFSKIHKITRLILDGQK